MNFSDNKVPGVLLGQFADDGMEYADILAVRDETCDGPGFQSESN